MLQLNLNNPIEIQAVGMNALKEALGPIGAVRFMQLYNPGYGDYTKERQKEPDMDPEEVFSMLKEFKNNKGIIMNSQKGTLTKFVRVFFSFNISLTRIGKLLNNPV